MTTILACLLAGFLALAVLALALTFRRANRPLSGPTAEAHARADALARWVAELNANKAIPGGERR